LGELSKKYYKFEASPGSIELEANVGHIARYFSKQNRTEQNIIWFTVLQAGKSKSPASAEPFSCIIVWSKASHGG
jgi:hypothetical protein